jgi:alkanesulfonate monooxygenase SsuD/methylene tetrahydromethanopterin reductase-like flavin-dependent oxidoreductase (luciferase family)
MAVNLKVAVTPWSAPAGWQAEELCAQAELAEAMGCHSFWLPENHFGGQRSIPSPLLLLAAVAARTTRIKLGSTSYLLPIRNPVLAAEEVAVLDQLSEGRVILGVGRGIQDSVFRAFDLQPAEKRKVFKTNLDIMCRAWRGEPLLSEDSGEPIQLAPLPVQQPHPPIWVAAFGPLALKQVAGLGLPYLASPVESLGFLEDNYRLYRSHLEVAGHDPVTTVPVMRTILVTADAGLARTVKDALQRGVPAAMRDRAGGVDDWAIVGDRHYVLDKMSEYSERLRLSHLIARGRLPAVSTEQQVASHQLLLELVGGPQG